MRIDLRPRHVSSTNTGRGINKQPQSNSFDTIYMLVYRPRIEYMVGRTRQIGGISSSQKKNRLTHWESLCTISQGFCGKRGIRFATSTIYTIGRGRTKLDKTSIIAGNKGGLHPCCCKSTRRGCLLERAIHIYIRSIRTIIVNAIGERVCVSVSSTRTNE